MTNNQIIQKLIEKTFTRSQIHDLFTAYYPKMPAADAETEAAFVADLFHTFAEWKQRGMSVKRGEKATFKNVMLWKMVSNKAQKTAKKTEKEDGEEIQTGHFIMVSSHLFSASQVEKATPAAKTSAADLRAYNSYLMKQRKAGNSSPLNMAAWKSQMATA